ncbi:MAG: hypothetical protein ACKPHU_06435, partial [Planctomycetaceae bacterium]
MQLFVVKSGLCEFGPLRRLLLFVLLAAGGGTCRADLLFGTTSGAPFTLRDPDENYPNKSGYRVAPEGSPFVNSPFSPLPSAIPLYKEPMP